MPEMTQPTGVLSYTRKDDEFFGGYISAFRKSLEVGVHVVTGEESFRVFQDIDGIVIGEQWEKKIADVIDTSTFFIPMLSPLFFSSEPCRDEVRLFLAHEEKLKRDDLILPIYFIESPKLEKPEETAKDAVAAEINKRERFDWREKANLSLQEPAAREAILELSRAIATSLERVENGPPQRAMDSAATRQPREGQAASVHAEHLAQLEAASRDGGDSASSRRVLPTERKVLWVDDNPSNNTWERRALQTYGLRFELATTTEEALEQLQHTSFDAIISDMGRPGDRRAGFTLLNRIRAQQITVPYLIYCGARAASLVGEAKRRDAQGITNDPDKLITMVLAAVGQPSVIPRQ